MSAAERKRRQRERDRAGQLLFETPDWRLFFDLATLPQKAGCQPADINKIALKELVDNALDIGTTVTLSRDGESWVVADDGPGLEPPQVPRLFSVNRPLLSSKLRRLPLRGMLGNGLRVVVGAVAATGGSLVVETRGHCLFLNVSTQTGLTTIGQDELVPRQLGLMVRIALPGSRFSDAVLARASIEIAQCGAAYSGPSSPWWYGVRDLHKLFAQAVPAQTTVRDVCRGLGMRFEDDRPAGALDRNAVEAVLEQLRAAATPVKPEALGHVGRACWPDYAGYARHAGTTITQAGAHLPYIVEAWASCARPTQKGQGRVRLSTVINRSVTLATIAAVSYPGTILLRGCGLERRIDGPGTGDYNVTVSIISPYVQLATDGKEPALNPFSEAIAAAIRKACGAAHRAMDRPVRSKSIKDAASYLKASGAGRYPANARQIMYAAQPDILRMTGKSSLDDAYFTQTLLPDDVTEHHKEAAWDVVFDSRGSFLEPHTGRDVALGTIEVRAYLGDRPSLGGSLELVRNECFPTHGPLNRYSAVLFIEKEGFTPLLQAARIAERFDIAIMSTKGMSTTAARLLLDRLAPEITKILVLHDFDVAGFSIFGTLGQDGRRYTFTNEVRLVDIGLRLDDVAAMNLQSEPVEISGAWTKRAATLREHGATWAEIEFLATRRVELNAMTADVFVGFLERKLVEHGVAKVLPDDATLEQHARGIIERDLAQTELDRLRSAVRSKAEAIALPPDMRDRLRCVLRRQPALPWDVALAEVVRRSKA